MADDAKHAPPSPETLLGGAAVGTAGLAVAAWAACCVLPMALAVAGLSVAGTALVAAQRGWLTLLTIPVLALGWWAVWRRRRACASDTSCPRPSARATWLLTAATALTVVAFVWEPLIEPVLISLLGSAAR